MRYISIEGNIGAGKSTLLDSLERAHPKEWAVFPEPVEEWRALLPSFYADPPRYAFLFQMEVLRTRAAQLDGVDARTREHKTVIVERSIDSSSSVFVPCLRASGHLNDMEQRAYDEWLRRVRAEQRRDKQELAGILYITASPETCLQRCQRRAREGEQSVDLAYLRQLDSAYQTWMSRMSRQSGRTGVVPTITLYTDDKTEEEVAEDGVAAMQALVALVQVGEEYAA